MRFQQIHASKPHPAIYNTVGRPRKPGHPVQPSSRTAIPPGPGHRTDQAEDMDVDAPFPQSSSYVQIGRDPSGHPIYSVADNPRRHILPKPTAKPKPRLWNDPMDTVSDDDDAPELEEYFGHERCPHGWSYARCTRQQCEEKRARARRKIREQKRTGEAKFADGDLLNGAHFAKIDRWDFWNNRRLSANKIRSSRRLQEFTFLPILHMLGYFGRTIDELSEGQDKEKVRDVFDGLRGAVSVVAKLQQCPPSMLPTIDAAYRDATDGKVGTELLDSFQSTQVVARFAPWISARCNQVVLCLGSLGATCFSPLSLRFCPYYLQIGMITFATSTLCFENVFCTVCVGACLSCRIRRGQHIHRRTRNRRRIVRRHRKWAFRGRGLKGGGIPRTPGHRRRNLRNGTFTDAAAAGGLCVVLVVNFKIDICI